MVLLSVEKLHLMRIRPAMFPYVFQLAEAKPDVGVDMHGLGVGANTHLSFRIKPRAIVAFNPPTD